MRWKKHIEILIHNWEDEIKQKSGFEDRANREDRPKAAIMWRHKREGLMRAVRDLKIVLKNKTKTSHEQ